ncbi:MAG: hypothetical protein K9G33_14220 [Sneathiella sp.]|nr:hypothetical protein [Sneathiella sp.]
MTVSKLLVANRGEIATRIFRAASELSIPTVAVYPADDENSLHTCKADQAVQLPGRGVPAYLDGAAILKAARETGATAIHPGYGFLSENAAFARQCAEEGITFIGPTPETLALFGDKNAARKLAEDNNIPILKGTSAPITAEEARTFFDDLGHGGAIMIKAVSGGGGRGMRPVLDAAELNEAFTRAESEARTSFGNGDLYAEQLIRRARHIEVQIIGDGVEVSHLWERDCSLQRRHQKIVELAPAPDLDQDLRYLLIEAALKLAGAVNYRNLGTVEFLVDGDTGAFYFIEANPRLQVEHTVTEEITDIDLVELQIQLAAGHNLAELNLTREKIPQPRGIAMQMRINAETIAADGQVKPGGGEVIVFEPPSGRGIRLDSYGYVGYRTNPAYDSLLAKLIVHTGSGKLTDIMNKGYRALCEFHLGGVTTNILFLQALLSHDAVRSGSVETNFIEEHVGALAAAAATTHPHLYFSPTTEYSAPFDSRDSVSHAGAKINKNDPLAVLAYGQGKRDAQPVTKEAEMGDGMLAVRAPLQGTLISLAVSEGDAVPRGAQLAVVEAMKMEHVITATASGIVRVLYSKPGDTLWEEQLLLAMELDAGVGDVGVNIEEVDLDAIRPDLAELFARRAFTLDENRPEALAKRRRTGQRTARENVEDLVDAGSFIEYGPLVVAAQRYRRDFEDLQKRSPADGLITGVGRVNGDQFDESTSSVAVMAYDYTVFAGTQGVHNHWKTDKILRISEQGRMPFLLFAEGGGGRPGDTDYGGFVGQNTFHHFGRLSGLVPMVSIVSGRCFAGNAALVGCCDVIIATENANIGMGGPAMIEGGGLGVFRPEEIGPTSEQSANGVVDIVVTDEAEAVSVAKRYLSYFQGRTPNWIEPDQRKMRALVPENRLRVYEIRKVIEILADENSVLELRRDFGHTMVTAFARVEGKPIGVIANDPMHLGGAIDSDGSDKASRFMQLCDAFDIPLVYLCDTPGIMVGPEAEKTALVRHASRLFLVGSNLSVPYFTVITRKAYGLGAIGMAGGNFSAPYFSVSWPTGEFGPMGLEGQVKLGYRAELEAIEDPDARLAYYNQMVEKSYQEGKAIERATTYNFDDTIDPAETRRWLAGLLAAVRPPIPRVGKKRPMIDSW